MNRYYTYAYLRPDKTPYYIGKGQGNRCYIQTRRSIKVPQKERIIFLKKNLSEADAFKHEVYMIAVLGRKDLGTGILRNLTDGGEGSSGRVMLDHMKEAVSKAQKGKTLTPEHLENLRLANLSRVKSDDERAKIKQKLSLAITLIAPSGIPLYFDSRKECSSWLGCSGNVIYRLLSGAQNHYQGYVLE